MYLWLRFIRLIIQGRVIVRGWWNLPLWRSRNVLILNHAYTGEEIAAIALLGHQYALRPWKGPYTFADKKNYYDDPRYRRMRWRLIPVTRVDGNGDLKSLGIAKEILRSGGNIIMFPEGHRTSKGIAWLGAGENRVSIPFKEGAAILAMEPGVTLRPVWAKVESKNMWGIPLLTKGKFVVGKPIDVRGLSREEITRKEEEALVDQGNQT